MKDTNIPQRRWEDYVQYRDRMSILEDTSVYPPHDNAANQEWGILNGNVIGIESEFDYEYLRWRYDESLTKEKY